MPTAWVAWRKILSCKQDAHLTEYDPKQANSSAIAPTSATQKPSYSAALRPNGAPTVKKRRSTSSSVCCNDLKNVVHGNTRVVHRSEQDSPLSHHHSSSPKQLTVPAQEQLIQSGPRNDLPPACTHKSAQAKKLPSCYDCSIAACEPPGSVSPKSYGRPSVSWCPPSTCHKCGDSVSDAPDAMEEHHAVYHSVTELKEGDSARSIVEIIFQTSWLRQDIVCARPERIFKVHNSPKTVAKFEEYRDMVKAKASKISKKHSRCLVDGNELLRFYSTTVACHMGKVRSSAYVPPASSLCASASCGVCQILRHGFPAKGGQPGIYTNASSGRAHGPIEDKAAAVAVKRAMLVCRVIAGRVKKKAGSHESSQEGAVISGYDSVAGEAGAHTDLEELLVFNNRAVLPCFVVVYSC